MISPVFKNHNINTNEIYCLLVNTGLPVFVSSPCIDY